MSEFKKETRYVVLKLSKLTDHQKTALGAALAEINLDESAMPECVVVEHDWPNYQETWEGIQAIVEGRFVPRDALAAQVEDLQLCLKERKAVCHQAFDANDALKAERDELATQVEALKDWRRLALQFDGHRMQAISTLKMVATGNFDMEEVRRFIAAAPVSGEQHLAEIREQAGRDGFIAGMYSQLHQRHCSQRDQTEAANQYADKIRQEGDK